jgi:hypothetical protein
MTIAVDELLELPSGATIINAGVDAGPREIRGAIRYRPGALLEAPFLVLPIARHRTIVLYDAGGPSPELRSIADKMRDDGFKIVRVLEASLADYERAGGPVQKPSREQTVPPAIGVRASRPE